MKDTNSTQKMTVAEAISYLKKNSKTKFDSSVEMHVNLNLDLGKVDSLRFSVLLPHGTGKSKKVAVLTEQKISNADLLLSESDIDKLEKGSIKPKVDFDILIAEPRFMPKLAKAARVLGPAGVMPNPKNGTVTDDVSKAVEQFKKGKQEVRMEQKAPVLHTIIGKVSFDDSKLSENYDEMLRSLENSKPAKSEPNWVKSIYLSTTMGSSVQVL